ncbi:MAG: GNAT family N-acetyltransferase [Microcoleaceae cyanobacterium]
MITIRPYFNSDWQAVCRVHDRAQPDEFVESENEYALIPLAENKNICKIFPACHRFVACETTDATLHNQTQVVGVIAAYRSYITLLYVDPDYQHQKIGKRLLKVILNIIGSPAWTVVIADNYRARKFYQGQGFQEVSLFPGEIMGKSCEFIRLRR